MPHEYVNWFDIKPPRSDSIENLTKLAMACDILGATHPAGKQTPYAIAQQAKVNYSQAARLLLKPGFVAVKYKGETVGYYWDKATFGNKYPSHYVNHTKAQVLSEYDTTPEESLGEKAQAARQIEHAIETATGKVVPLLYAAQKSEGKQLTEYRIIFNIIDDATVENYTGPIQAVAEKMLESLSSSSPDMQFVKDSLDALMVFNLALKHKERNND